MGDFGQWEDGTKMPPCFTCAPDDEKHGLPSLPAEMICMVKQTDGSHTAIPLCLSHAQMGMVAGWYPQHKIDSPDGRKAWDEVGFRNPGAPK